MKSKMYTTQPRKPMMYGGKATQGRTKMAAGGKMPMVEKDGKMVPSFAADGKGKMMYGGKATKGRSKMMYGGNEDEEEVRLWQEYRPGRSGGGKSIKAVR